LPRSGLQSPVLRAGFAGGRGHRLLPVPPPRRLRRGASARASPRLPSLLRASAWTPSSPADAPLAVW